MEEINRKRKRVEAEAGEGASASGKHTAPPNVRTASSSSGGSGGGSRAATDANTADGNNGENKTACDTDSGSKFVLQNVQLAEHLRHTPQPLSGKYTRAATSNLAAPTGLLSLCTTVYIYIERESDHLKISLLTLFCLFVTPFVAAGVRADGETRAIETDTLTRLVRIYLSFTKHWRNVLCLVVLSFFPSFKKREVDGVALRSLIVLR